MPRATQSAFDNGLALGAAVWIPTACCVAHPDPLFGPPDRPALTPAIDNLIMDGPRGRPALEEMVARTGAALLLTCLWYIREVDPQTLLLTGLTRDGVYLVEGGEVVGAVNNFRFNECPVGPAGPHHRGRARTEPTLPREWTDYFTRTAMPPLRIADFNMSSVSQAS